MKTEDDLLIKLIKIKDKEAYTILFQNYYRTLKTQAFFILKDKMEAEDQVQNLFIEIIDGRLGVNVNTSLIAYLKTCMYHKCLMVLNKEKRIRKHIDMYTISCNSVITYDYFQKTESEQYINKLLMGLSIQRLEVCKQVYLEQKKYKEAAVEMGITVNSVKTHLRLATKTLRDRFVESKTEVMNVLYA
ncbi:RNA polymerase sigma factor [Mucilaginibacter sp.]|jgi:RNA polymerase sigma-70 factor (ECF subfamily)|uniref:RNA polymerase sigma factor n=1 Tax=Mucilaginibacter sp. TaxID=1882438 RepID=UPI0035616624